MPPIRTRSTRFTSRSDSDASDHIYSTGASSPGSIPPTPFMRDGQLELSPVNTLQNMTLGDSFNDDGAIYVEVPGASSSHTQSRERPSQVPHAHFAQEHHALQQQTASSPSSSSADTGPSSLLPQMSQYMRAAQKVQWDIRFPRPHSEHDTYPALIDGRVLSFAIYSPLLGEDFRILRDNNDLEFTVEDVYESLYSILCGKLYHTDPLYASRTPIERAEIEEATQRRIGDPSIKVIPWEGQLRDILGNHSIVDQIVEDYSLGTWPFRESEAPPISETLQNGDHPGHDGDQIRIVASSPTGAYRIKTWHDPCGKTQTSLIKAKAGCVAWLVPQSLSISFIRNMRYLHEDQRLRALSPFERVTISKAKGVHLLSPPLSNPPPIFRPAARYGFVPIKKTQAIDMSSTKSRSVRFSTVPQSEVSSEYTLSSVTSPRSMPSTPFITDGQLELSPDMTYMTESDSSGVSSRQSYSYHQHSNSHTETWNSHQPIASRPPAVSTHSSVPWSSPSVSSPSSCAQLSATPPSLAFHLLPLMSQPMKAAQKTPWDVRFEPAPTSFDHHYALQDASAACIRIFCDALPEDIVLEQDEDESEGPFTVADVYQALYETLQGEVTADHPLYAGRSSREKADIQDATACRLGDPTIKARRWKGQLRDLLGKYCVLERIIVDEKLGKWRLDFVEPDY
ncbi:hypothetical protein D9619_007626 [Psilocybe cf. subviscida]|uniref:DUF6699 domain-containing protein n=1 Tax=Psilocybe cf. subviscida TaxID=2480587 RepID=A0A8H5ATU0_9AGAR|nr:hypothetical protein D9619_007626 [Psilocybe cf. subviscida]